MKTFPQTNVPTNLHAYQPINLQSSQTNRLTDFLGFKPDLKDTFQDLM
ncbi:MAG: hypothetical protein IPM92_11830 [Saprospiraceae bacterium]|nr:hypothetical protein [Saprospiraceae bacterium]